MNDKTIDLLFDKSKLLKDFSDGFKLFLHRQNLDTKDLAKKLGVTDSAVSSWKYGRAFPDVPNYLKLVWFGLSPFEIMGDNLELQAKINDCEFNLEKNRITVDYLKTNPSISSISNDVKQKSFIEPLEKENRELVNKIKSYETLLAKNMGEL